MTAADFLRASVVLFGGLPSGRLAIFRGLPSNMRVTSSISVEPMVSFRSWMYDRLRAALKA